MSHRQAVDDAVADVDFEAHSYQIVLETTAGVIRLNLDSSAAPNHCKNMIGLARIGFYDSKIFHRVIKGFMIQGGCPDGTGMGGPGYQIDAEFNDKPHVTGVLSMARSNNPNSAGSQFFICLGTHAYLDGQYTAFGEAADEESLNVVKAIGETPCGGDDRPHAEMQIVKVTVETL